MTIAREATENTLYNKFLLCIFTEKHAIVSASLIGRVRRVFILRAKINARFVNVFFADY